MVGAPAAASKPAGLFSGQPDGTLALTGIIPIAAGAAALRLTDVDGDAKCDLLVVSTTQVVALRNAYGPWENLGRSLAGGRGFSKLVGEGTLQPGSALGLGVVHVPRLAPLFLVLGISALNAPFKGGTLVPQPLGIRPLGVADGQGELHVVTTWPTAPASGTSFVAQVWFIDPGGPAGLASTNGIRGTSP